MNRTFDAAINFDSRSRNFPATLGLESKPLRSYTWGFPKPVYLNQLTDGACVGFSWAHQLATRRGAITTTDALAFELYKAAQLVDEFDGENYDGSSVLAGAKVVTERYGMTSYRWAFGIEDVCRVLGYSSSCVLGLNWYTDMLEADAKGYVYPTGRLLGRHALLARGLKVVWRNKDGPHDFGNLDLEQSYVLLRNSWGREWSLDGDCKISVANLEGLLGQRGECCVPAVRI